MNTVPSRPVSRVSPPDKRFLYSEFHKVFAMRNVEVCFPRFYYRGGSGTHGAVKPQSPKGTEFISPARECGEGWRSDPESLQGRHISCRTPPLPTSYTASSAPRSAVI